VICALLTLLALRPSPAAACTGDCDGNNEVTVNELLVGVNMALGKGPVTLCPSFDRNLDDAITIDELLNAVKVALSGCPPSATPTDTPTPVGTPAAAPTPTTPLENEAPLIPGLPAYRTYPGFPIRLPIGASDPEGGPVHYRVAQLPDGAVLDENAGVLSWLPRDDQLGPFDIPFTVTDEGEPPKSAASRLAVQVSPLDACIEPTCVPASGCESVLVPLSSNCCDGEPKVRVAEAQAECPEGRVLLIGRNTEGFGRLQDCDRVRVVSFAQGGTAVRLNIAARCVNADAPVTLQARLEMSGRVLFDRQQDVIPQLRESGYAEARAVAFAISGAVRFLDLEGQEADLDIMLTDHDGVAVSTRLRLTLTAQALPDLPETDLGALHR
jgi:hypothetical protein